MAASYPGAIKSFTQQVDDVDTVDAADINQAYDEIEAIETELGVNLENILFTSHNLIRNYPSIENADGSQPLWWNETGSGTLTEEDATGEAIGSYYHERVLKFVVSASGGGSDYFFQSFTHSDEPLINTNVTKLSVGCWVYMPTAGTFTMEMWNAGGAASLGTVTNTETNTWVWVDLKGLTVGTSATEIRFYHSANDAIFYIAALRMNTGTAVGPFKPRGLRRQYSTAQLYAPADPGGAVTTVDCTSDLGNMAVALQMRGGYYNTTTVNISVTVRYYGSSTWVNWINNRDLVARYYRGNKFQLLDDQQRFEFDTNAAAGDTEQVFFSVDEIYYIWE